MRNVEIPASDWPVFLGEFSRLHRNRTACLTVFDRTLRVQVQTRPLPFRDVQNTPSASAISIHLGDKAPIEYGVDHAARLHLEQDVDGFEALDIVESNGMRTILEFAAPPLVPPIG